MIAEATGNTFDRKRKTKDPCAGCGLHRDRCLCGLIPSLETRTRLCLIIHRREMKRTTNTGQLAFKSLVNSELRIRGGLDKSQLDVSDLTTSSYRPVLFFPSRDAVELTREFVEQSSRPICLIVPDGNWRQASKVHGRYPDLAHVPRVKISAPNLAATHLRAEHMAEGMSTLEAIARAFGIIESVETEAALLALYQLKLERTLAGRARVSQIL